MSDVQFTDNSQQFKDAMEDRIQTALEAIGQAVESYAKGYLGTPKPHANGEVRPNRVTARLINSITFSTKKNPANRSYVYDDGEIGGTGTTASHGGEQDGTVYVGTNVEYAAYVEMGTSRMRPYPYLKPAVVDHVQEYKKLADRYLKD